jgi:predicted alpha-1,2-mannosidase
MSLPGAGVDRFTGAVITGNVVRRQAALALSGLVLAVLPAPASAESLVADPASLVDPMIGTSGSVDTFPGADMPFGMVQWSPDTTPDRARGGGYEHRDSDISGFSLTHLSGPGCSAAGDLPILPYTGDVSDDPGGASVGFSHDAEHAVPGYYSVTDDAGTTTELTTTTRAGIGRFAFPSGADAHLLLKLHGSATPVDGAHAHLIGDREIAGWIRSGHFCGRGNHYTVHFDLRFDHPVTRYRAWSGGVALGFDTSRSATVTVKAGISYVSERNAALNVQREIPHWDFAGVHRAATNAWNNLLGRIRIGGGTTARQTVFYTALYHSLLHPNVFSDVNRQYAGMDGRVHTTPPGHLQYANFSGWDVYRSQIQLLSLVAPNVAADAIASMLRDDEQTGRLPKWSLDNDESYVMVGDPAAPIVADAWAFGARGFDGHRALAALVRQATRPNGDRPGERVREAKGFLPLNGRGWGCCGFYGPLSTQLEYDTADYAVASLARSLGDRATYRRFAHRAQDWRNVFNHRTGYLQPRLANGAWAPHVTPASTAGTVEGTIAQYTPMVPFNLGGLIGARGGRAAYSRYLDGLLRDLRHPGPLNADLGNEPSLEIPWEYDWTGEPWKTQGIVRRVQQELWTDSPAGFIGNDDLGEMSSWYVWSALGLYPETPGTDTLAVGSPAFPEARVRLGGGRDLVITGSGGGPYVHGMTLGGRAWQRPWVTFGELARGARLDFALGGVPDRSWGASPAAAPPSDNG